jgi:hypothetical protein
VSPSTLTIRKMDQNQRNIRLRIWSDRFDNRGWNKFYRKQLQHGIVLCYSCEKPVEDGEEFFLKRAQQSKACHITCALPKHLITRQQYREAIKIR